MSSRWSLAILFFVLSSCGKKQPVEASTDEAIPTKFVAIDLSEEEDELAAMMGSELQAAIAPCGDLVRLEPSAIMGRLKDGEIRCLDRMLRESEKQTVRKKVSLVLYKDAWAKNNLHRWEGIVRRHLTEIDQSDPALVYVFARHLAQKGPDYMEEAIRWADVALDNRSAWVGEDHVNKVFTLRKMKAISAHKRWQWLAEKYATEPTEELAEAQRLARNQTKTLAREWLDYARSAERETDTAYQLCISAAGTDGFCEESGEDAPKAEE